jgi:hypothetical protein
LQLFPSGGEGLLRSVRAGALCLCERDPPGRDAAGWVVRLYLGEGLLCLFELKRVEQGNPIQETNLDLTFTGVRKCNLSQRGFDRECGGWQAATHQRQEQSLEYAFSHGGILCHAWHTQGAEALDFLVAYAKAEALAYLEAAIHTAS